VLFRSEQQLIGAITQLINAHSNNNLDRKSSSTSSTPSSDTLTNQQTNNPFPHSIKRQAPTFSKISQQKNDLDQELFSMLLVELPKFKKMIMHSFEDKNLQALEEHSHKLHGAACYCNVPDLKNAIQILERAARNKDTKDMKKKVVAVRSEIDLILQSANYG